MDLGPMEALELKGLMERNDLAKAAVYEALNKKSLRAFYAKKREYEETCIDLWLFNMNHGKFPRVQVKIPDTRRA